MARKEKLLLMLESDAMDPFLQYAVAQEFLSENDIAEGANRLRSLIESVPAYHAAHFRLGQVLSENGNSQEAIEILRLGIEAAAAAGDQHAVAEMSGFLEMIGETNND